MKSQSSRSLKELSASLTRSNQVLQSSKRSHLNKQAPWEWLLEMADFLELQKKTLKTKVVSTLHVESNTRIAPLRSLTSFTKWNTPRAQFKLGTPSLNWVTRNQTNSHKTKVTSKRTCFWVSTIGQKLKLRQSFNLLLKIQFSLKKLPKGKICWKLDSLAVDKTPKE